MRFRDLYILILIVVAAAGAASCAKTTARGPSVKEGAGERSVPNQRVHFAFDSEDVLLEDMKPLDENAEWMKLHGDAVLILEGHCDELGLRDYNMELGDRRARTVKAHLIEKGVPHDRVIMVVSFGSARPLDEAHSNEAWRRNRRVEFILR